jgi:D-beta-D-heptose 7-phosphate kinase/D-beta-D-heptose 1-phosphate adenosyltransferase
MQTTKIIWTNGCFDVLHRGHIELLKYAKSLGDWLVVGIDTDERVKSSKGESRPFNNIEDRVAMLESIKYVADVMVVGSDYKDKEVIGSRHVQQVKFFDRIDGYSTTKILVGLQ